MDKEHFTKLLIEQQEKGKLLLSLVSNMHESKNDFGDGMVMFGGEDLYYVPEDDLNSFLNKLEAWKSYVYELLRSQFGKDDQFVYDWDSNIGTYISKREPILPQLKKKVNKGLSLLDSFIQRLDFHFHVEKSVEKALKQDNTTKTPKVFISHKKEDEAYADALVSLINFILGPDGDKIFCSSVPGYGIRLSGDILDKLKAQFDNYNIFMVIIHSPRYYKSAICMNEMGASWALGTKFSSFMTKDCKYEHMHGVIGHEKICVNLNDDIKTLNAHLNDFKDDLVDFFGAGEVDQNKWENARGRFIDEVSTLSYTPNESDADLFELLYIPAFDHIFELLDLDNFHKWAYSCAISGNTVLSASIFENIGKVTRYIKSRPKHKEYASWDSLIHNLGLLVNEFEMVFYQHAEKIDDSRYIVERFYKRYVPNPNYEEDLAAYNEHVMLVSDMIFELARLCNLILSRIRTLYPEYKKDLGLLHVDNRLDCPDLVYRDSEISDTPYPGLKQYIKIRTTRETHLGNNANIDASGYVINSSMKYE